MAATAAYALSIEFSALWLKNLKENLTQLTRFLTHWFRWLSIIRWSISSWSIPFQADSTSCIRASKVCSECSTFDSYRSIMSQTCWMGDKIGDSDLGSNCRRLRWCWFIRDSNARLAKKFTLIFTLMLWLMPEVMLALLEDVFLDVARPLHGCAFSHENQRGSAKIASHTIKPTVWWTWHSLPNCGLRFS